MNGGTDAAGGPDSGNASSRSSAAGWTRGSDRPHEAASPGLCPAGPLAAGQPLRTTAAGSPAASPLTAVVMPAWQHLELIGKPAEVKQHFERVTGARLLLHHPGP